MSARAPYGGHGHRLGKRENHQWLKSHGIIPVAHGDGAADRIKAIAPGGVDAFIDTHGGGYVDLALAIGVAADRIDTIADYAAAQKYGSRLTERQKPGQAHGCSLSWPV